jgi:DNA-3-methyladenine glycosylase
MHLRKLPRSFYLRPTLTVAKELLGKYLVRRRGNTRLLGKIVEVEAYLGEHDPASHAYRGKTRRNAVMFHAGGHLYVYFTYGMHFCSNVVTEREGRGCAVLLRAVEPVAGITAMQRNRRSREPIDLCSGPAKLCQAFGIRRKDNGADLCGSDIWIAEEAGNPKKLRVGTSRRIGVTDGKQHHWRFYLKNTPFISCARLPRD